MAERKKFIDCKIPLLNSTMRVLGTPEELNNKTIKLDLTRRLKGKGLTITFQIFNKEGKLIAIPKKMELVKPYIQRMMRKRVDYVEDSFATQSQDIKITIKPFLITRKRVSRAVRRNLRNTTKEFLVEYIKSKDYLELCEEIFNGVVQRTLLPKLKKVYPLSFCDLRVLETKDLQKIDFSKILLNEETVEEINEDEEEVEKEEEDDSTKEEEDDSTEEEEEKEESTEEEEE